MKTKSDSRGIVKSAIWILPSLFLTVGLTSCSDSGTGAPTEVTPSMSTVTRSADRVIDITNPEQVAGFASDIFFAEVKEVRGSTEKRGVLESQYLVSITETLKGQAEGEVVVNQGGGISEGVVYVEEGDELLTQGGTYLIAARYNPEENWYTLVPVGGDTPVSENPSQSRSASGRQVEGLDDARSRMLDAIANQIPFEGLPAPAAPTSTAAVTPPPATSVPPSLTPAPSTTLPPLSEPPSEPTVNEEPTTTAPTTTKTTTTTTTTQAPR